MGRQTIEYRAKITAGVLLQLRRGSRNIDELTKALDTTALVLRPTMKSLEEREWVEVAYINVNRLYGWKLTNDGRLIVEMLTAHGISTDAKWHDALIDRQTKIA